MKKEKFILVEWPEIQYFMEHPNYNKCFIAEPVFGEEAIVSNYMVPESLYEEVMNNINK